MTVDCSARKQAGVCRESPERAELRESIAALRADLSRLRRRANLALAGVFLYILLQVGIRIFSP